MNINVILYSLANGDLSKAKIIENENVDVCYGWYYMQRVRELNKMIINVAELEKIKN